MKEITLRENFNILNKKRIKKFVVVSDSTMMHIIDDGLKKEKSMIKSRFMKSLE